MPSDGRRAREFAHRQTVAELGAALGKPVCNLLPEAMYISVAINHPLANPRLDICDRLGRTMRRFFIFAKNSGL
jgi:hypothetical protein